MRALWFSIRKRSSKIAGWKQKLLSQTGREVLIKSIIQAIPNYGMQMLFVTEGFLKQAYGICPSFLLGW